MRICKGIVLACLSLPSSLLAQNWIQQTPATSPQARDSSVMVYDPLHHQTVLFGGEDAGGTPLNDTWVYDGATWTQLHPAASPPARLWAGIAFDAGHGQVVLFGGTTTGGPSFTYLNDTWLWDGTNWTQANPSLSPSGRQAPAMAYDSVHGQVVLFGGANTVPGALADTWTWNGTTWAGAESAPVPARRFASMSFDLIRQQIVMFGGDDGTNTKNDTWLWSGLNWSQASPAHSPSARSSQGQAWNPVINTTVMFGGGQAADTWLWNGTDWTQETTATSPPARFYVNMAYDLQHADMVLFGGSGAFATGDLNDTWKLGYTYAQSWMLATSPASNFTVIGPSARTNASAAVGFGAAQVFGGSDGTKVLNDITEWTGAQWFYTVPAHLPPARQSAALAFDPVSGDLVLFGGNSSVNGTALLSDTWFWTGGDWSPAPVPGPSARQGHAMATDALHKNVVLFGGFTGSYAADTWEWLGGSWSQVSPATSPGSRAYHSMVFDGTRDQVVLFGGFNGTYLNDTWVWDGTNWTQKNPANSPSARDNFALVYDSVHGTVLLFGGQNASGALHDTWLWDGYNWTQLSPGASPGGRYGMASVYLPSAGQFLIYGGTNGSSDLQEGWAFGSPSVTTTFLPVGYSQQSYSYTIVPSGGVAPYTFTPTGAPYSPNNFGLTFNNNTGTLTGIDEVSPGQTPVGYGITVKDSQGQSTLLTFTLITDAAITLSPNALPDGTMGANYSVTLSASGGTAPFTFSAGGLPAGLNFNGTQIVGQCTASSTNVTLGVVDSLGGTASVGPIPLNCNPAPLITNTSPLPNGTVGVFYSVPLTTNAVFDPPGAAPYTWSVPPNSLPAGLSLSSTGVISGVPTTLGPSTFTVTFTDRWNATTNKQFQITIINPFAVTTTALADGNLNIAFPAGQAIAAVGGLAPYHFAAVGLPPGLAINANTGAITGTPTQAGSFSPNFTVTDQSTGNVQAAIPITVAAAGTNSEDWVQLSPASPPAGRQGASMFYDSVHNRTILFGGSFPGEPGVLGDTNSWDGTAWTTLSPANSPSARSAAIAAFDAAHGAGVLFGGFDQTDTQLNDTWLWNGATWTQAVPATSPPVRTGAAMAYDGHQIVLFGGSDNGPNDLADTWIWNGTTWSQVTPANSPSGRRNAAMAYDSVRNKVVLFGGANDALESDYADTWIWDGGALTWTQITTATQPAARDSHAMAFDALHGQTLLFGGSSAASSVPFGDTWAWNGTAWTQLTPPHQPSARGDSSMVYDAAHSEAILFGGLDGSFNDLNDTWIFGGPVASPLTLPTGTQGVLYSASVSVAGGFPPYTFIAPAVLPPGISFNTANGTFGGTPTGTGPYTIAVPIQDSEGVSTVPQFSLTVNPPAAPLVLQPVTLPNATFGQNYLEQLSASGGVPAYIFSVTGLPNGLTINSSNQIVGQCAAGSASNNVMLKVTDSATPVPNTAIVGPLTVSCNAAPSITSTSPLANGIVNASYTTTLQMSGGTAPIAWTLTPGTLPAGFTLSNAGVLAGSATAPVTSQFSVTVTDFWGASFNKAFTLTFYPVLSITSAALPNGVQGSAYPNGTTLAVTGGTGIGTYHFIAGGFPTGLQIDPSSGAITGIPTQFGAFHPTFTVTDQTPQTAVKQINMTVTAAGILTLSPTTLPDATAATNYSEQLSAVGGVPPYFFTASGLPAGLHFNANNQIVGQCTAASNNVMLGVTDSATPPVDSASAGPLTVNCNATPSISSTSPLAKGIVNAPYTANLQMGGGTAPIAWSLTPGTLPAGFTLSNAGVLAGTATAPVTSQFSITVTDFWGASTNKAFTVTFESVLTITSSSLPADVQGSPYPNGTTLAVSGGTGAGTYQFSAVGLPTGLQIDPSSGAITGKPTQFGNFQPTFTVTDQTPQTVIKQIALTILANTGNPNWTNLNPATGPNARDSYAMAYDPVRAVTVLYGGTAGGGDTWTFGFPSQWSLQTPAKSPQARFGAAMAWMAPQNNTVLFGGQINAVIFNQTWVWDGANWTQRSPATIPPARNYQAMAADSAHHQVVMFGGSTGVGPAGAQNDTWVWDGTNWTKKSPANVPTAAYGPAMADGPTGPVLFGGIDAASNELGQTWVWDGANWNLQTPAISPPARDLAGMAFNSQTGKTLLFGGFNGAGSLQDTWQWDGQNWTQLNPATVPTARNRIALAFDSGFNQTILFGGQNVPELGDTWALGGPAVTNTALPVAAAGVNYSATIAAIGGTPPYTFTQTGNPQSLPAGLTLNNATGKITGATQAAGAYSVGISVVDSQTASVTPAFSLTVTPASILVLSPVTLPDATAGANYTAQLSALGGVAPYFFAAGGLPAGLHLNANNQIAGQCTAASANVTLAVTDSATPAANTASVGPLTVHCNAAPSITTTSPLPSGIVNTQYSDTLQMTGGTAPIAWTLTPGSLPVGFTLSNAGVLTGIATAPVFAKLTATVTDLWGATINKVLTLAFYPVLTITTNSLPNSAAGTAYPAGVSLAVTGGTGNGTYVFSAVGLPNGYSIDPASGLISGTTQQTGPFTATFKVTDQDAQVAVKQISFAISAATGILMTSPPNLPFGTSGQSYSFQPQWSGGVAPFTVGGAGLPAWLSLNAATGKLTGTPPSGGAFVFTLTVTDSQTPVANTGAETFTLVVNPPSIATASPLPAATIAVFYSQNLTANGGTPPYKWTAAGLPAWLSLSNAGALTGTPPANTPASVSFNLTVTDSLGAFANGSVTLPVLPTPNLLFKTTSPLPSATVSVPYSTIVQAIGGNGVYTFSSSGLPGWLTLDGSTGGLTGIPPINPGAGPVTFQLTVSDTVNQSLSQNFTLQVNVALTIDTTSPLPPATVGAAYSGALSASGGTGNYSWSAAGQPAWLKLSPGGVFSGTPTQAGPVSFQITLKDTQTNNSVTETFNLQVDSALTINTASPLPAATANFPYLETLAASGGSGIYHWSAAGLPASFNLSAAGVLQGTPQSAAPIAFNVTVTDTLNNSLTQSFTLPVNTALTINTASPLAVADPLVLYSANFSASGGNPGYTWNAAGLPSWLTLTAAGFLSGTAPPGTPAASFQVTVTDSASHSVTAPFTVPVNGALTITTASLPAATVNVHYSTTLVAAGGSGGYMWSAKGLPAGLAISAGGVLSGALPLAGPYAFQITVTDSQTASASSNFTLLVSGGLPLSFATQSLPPCAVNINCSAQIVVTGGIPPYVFSLALGANLHGLTLAANGVIGGTPQSAGPISIPVIVTDQQSSISRTYTLTVSGLLTISTASLAPGTVGLSYNQAVTAGGGQPPYSFSLSAGSLPPGLNLDPVGNIFGTPSLAGTYTFSLQANDSVQSSPPQQLSITIVPAPTPLTIASPSQLAPGNVGTAYSQNLAAIGGSGQYTWAISGGSLPAGLTLAPNGAITGTPTTAGMANFSATVHDTGGNSATAPFSLPVTSSSTVGLITANPLPNGAVDKPYNYGIEVAGGTPPYLWSITAGQVPPGLSFDNTTGTLSGTPTLSGSFALVLTVVDSGGAAGGGQGASIARKVSARASVTSNYTIQIAPIGGFQITTSENLPNGTLDQSYSTKLSASGGVAPYRWQLVNGDLPAGLALDAGGNITGTPATAGTSSLVVRVTDSTGATSTGALVLQVANPRAPAVSAVPEPPAGQVGISYQTAFSAVGGQAPYSWSIRAGALPPGLSLAASSGTVSGTPSLRGSFQFTLQVTDSANVSGILTFVIRVNSATLQISPQSIPNGTANVPYSFGLNVSGGTGPYTWSLSSGGLLSGFTIDPTGGDIGGTPTVAGTYQFTISVADSNFGVASQVYQFTVQSNGLSIVTSSTPPATVGTAYILGLQAANAVTALTWSVTSGALPPGLTLAGPSGMLAGTPTAAGSYTFTVQVADTVGGKAQATFTLLVNPQPLTIVTATLPAGAVGTAYSQTIQSAGGKPSIAWSVASGALPAGLSLGGATGTLSGTPTAVGSFAFTVQATDSTGATAQQRFSVNIAGPPPVPSITLTGLPAISNPGDQPVVSINLSSGYPLPIQVTATLSINPNRGNTTDLMFSNGSRTTQIAIPANTTQSTLTFQTGTLPGTITLSLTLSAAGVDVTPAAPPTATTTIAASVPVITSVAVATTSTGLQITVVGTSTTLDMKTAGFHFTPVAGSTLQTTDISVDVSGVFAAWYSNAASLATGSQFSLTIPFTVGGNTSTIASVTVTLTNSVGASKAVSANVP